MELSDLTQSEIVWLFGNISEAINKISETVKQLAKAIKEIIDKTVDELSEFFSLVKEREKSNKTKTILKKLSPKHIYKKIKQYLKRKV